MAGVYLSLISNRPGAQELVLINGEPSATGYKLDRNGGVDLGGAVYDKVYSGPRGTQGAVLAGATPQNRLSTFTLQAIGDSEDDLQRLLSQLWTLDEDLRPYGGTAYWRAWGSSFLMELKVLDSSVGIVAFDPSLWPAHHIMRVQLALVTPPYMSGPPMDVLDDFSGDSLVDYSFDLGTGEVAIAGGQLTVLSNATVEKRLIRNGAGYDYYDHQVTLKPTVGGVVAAFKASAIVKHIDAANYLEAYVDGTSQTLRLDKVSAGARTNLANTALTAGLQVSTAVWVRGRIEGNNVFAEYFTALPSPMGTPTNSLTYTLSAAEQAKFGEAVAGRAGIAWIPRDLAALIDDFTVEAFVYRNRTLPDTVTLRGIPGDAPALVSAEITPSGGAAAPIWASLGWWPLISEAGWNRVWNGNFENAFLDTKGWSVAAVLGLTGAATSITRTSAQGGKYGTFAGQIVCPATSGTGANFRIFRRFRKGVTYTAELWVHAAAATTNVQLKLGNAAGTDIATSGSTALSAIWQRITVSWTPTADRDDAHLAVVIAAATATTFEIDGVIVYEGSSAPASANQSEGRGGIPPLGLIEAENSTNGATANANLRSGFGSTPAGGNPGVVVDPALLVGDDFAAETISVEVWARVELIAGTSSALAILAAYPITSAALAPIFSEEYGGTGKTLTLPSSGTARRLVRLGTLRLPTNAGRYLLSYTTSGSVPAVDYFVLLPANARALSPSGVANDASFPAFDPITSELTRLIYPDISGAQREPATGSGLVSAPGLGGSLIEFAPGDANVLAKLSSLVPDDPTANTSTEQLAHSATLHFQTVPRWRLGRS